MSGLRVYVPLRDNRQEGKRTGGAQHHEMVKSKRMEKGGRTRRKRKKKGLGGGEVGKGLGEATAAEDCIEEKDNEEKEAAEE